MADRIYIFCERCGHEQDLLTARSDQEWYELVGLILSLPAVLHNPIWSYLGLFKPVKQKLRSSTMLKIVKDLEGPIRASKLERNGVEYDVNGATFASAMMYLYESPPKSMRLPLRDNKYLFSVLINRAEQLLAKAEIAHESKLRHQPERQAQGMSSAAEVIRETPKKAAMSKNERNKKGKQNIGGVINALKGRSS